MNATVPVGVPLPGALTEIVASRSTNSPPVNGVSYPATSDTVVVACCTVRGAVPLDPRCVKSPPYVAVTVSAPVGAVLAVHDACPALRSGVVHIVVASVAKVTVPEGVPATELTLAE